MTELTDIIQVFGAIDEQVVSEPDLTTVVADMLPAYAHGAAGWFKRSQEWIRDLRGVQVEADRLPSIPPRMAPASRGEGSDGSGADGEGAPPEGGAPPGQQQRAPESPPAPAPLDVTLDSLARTQPGGTVWRTRRLLAAWVLARIAGDEDSDSLTGVPTDQLLLSLVPLTGQQDGVDAGARVSGLSDEGTGRAEDLLALMQDEARYPTLAAFPALVADAQQRSLLPDEKFHVVPNRWTVTYSPTSPGPAVAFSTHHRLHGVTLADVLPILDPSEWTTYVPPWCSMATVAGGATGRKFGARGDSSRIVELVADDCVLSQALYAFQTCLDFLYSDLPGGGGVLEYRRSPNQKANGGDGAVTIDEGSLVVQQVVPGTVDVVTTKRVQFLALRGIPPFAAGMLAQFTWVLGYASLAELFIDKVMKGAATGSVQVIHPRPIEGNVLDRAARRGSKKASRGSKRARSGDRSGLEAVLSETMGDCRDGMRSSLSKVASGTYGTDDYAADIGKVVGHGRRQAAAVAQFWTTALSDEDGTGEAGGGSRGEAE